MVLVAAAVVLRGTRSFLDHRVLLAAGAGLAAFVAAALLGATPVLSLMGRFPRYEGIGMLLLYVGLAAAGAVVICGQRLQQALLALAALQAVLLTQVVWETAQGGARVATSVGNASDLAVVGLTGFGVLLWHALTYRYAWLWAGTGAAAFVVLLSGSRGGWFGLVAIVAGAVVLLATARRWRTGAWAGGMLLAAAAVVLAVPGTRSRLLGEGLAFRTADGRLLMWRETLALVGDRPMTGAGPSRFVDEIGAFHTEQWARMVGPENPPDSPHNVVLQVLASTGILGAVAALAAVVVVVVLLLRARSDWARACLLASLGAGVALCFHFTTLWALGPLLMCLGGALAARARRAWPWVTALLVVAAWAAVVGVLTMVSEERLAGDIERLAATESGAGVRLVATISSKSWDPDFVRRGGYALVSFAEQGEADPAPALSALSTACDRLPRSTECAQTLGNAQLLAGHADDAVRTLYAVIDHAPTNSDTWLWLADARAVSGDMDGAVEALVRVTELRPDDPTAWDALVVAYERMGEARLAEAARAEADARR
ncbi:MAG: O-antigen ligase family protein [Tessaracoccus sp.]|uniref:O-antigen ligase family protein n=1 Tax=Tessaracoccus sp. TaxID=1971211 RepID=UPI001ECA1F41|nr:O-antigen ligase family protein [Tessaracoccus sp.]MBK7821534.1 O-antigen ligase family protein [Tessaracoccus sp.]